MQLDVRVYLNEGPDNFLGFHNAFTDDPRLRMAAAFILEASENTVTGTPDLGTTLDVIYEQLNVGGTLVPAEPWTTRYRAEGNRSLSVGDVVVLGETAHSCQSIGWKMVTTDDLVNAIAAFNAKGAHGL